MQSEGLFSKPAPGVPAIGNAMKTKQQVVSEFRRSEIISAARTIFARGGFDAGIMDEIAREAGVAKGTLYLYFRNKTEIYKAVLDHDMRELKESTIERLDAANGLKNKIRAFMLARLERARVNREFFRIMDSDSRSLTYTRSQYRDWLREPVLRLAAALEKRSLLASTDAQPARDADFLLDFIWNALQPAPPSRKR